jgi:hypothetical protein
MVGLTLAIAAAASVLVFFLTPVYGLAVYIAVLGWYPSYLTIKLGTIDFNVCRIVILAIYANLLLRTRLPNRFRFILLDKLVIVYFLCQILAGFATTSSLGAFLENRAGAVFSLVLPYFAVRVIVTNKEEYITLLKVVVIVSAPLAVVGFYQFITGDNPVGFLREYGAWGAGSYVPYPRAGFFRANVTFPHPIMYGLFFAIFGPICAGIFRSINSNKFVYAIGIGLMGVGVFTSLSSGPYLAALISIMFLAFYRYRKYWKEALVVVIVMCGIVEVISNRHFYDVLGSHTLSPTSAYGRSRLIDVAFFEGGMSGHWLVGHGDVDPGWGPMIDGREHTDIVNHYILILCRYGLVGLIPFAVMLVVACRTWVYAWQACVLDSDRWLLWCLSGAMFGLLISLVSVSLFDQPQTAFYVMLAFCGAAPMVVAATNAERPLNYRFHRL